MEKDKAKAQRAAANAWKRQRAEGEPAQDKRGMKRRPVETPQGITVQVVGPRPAPIINTNAMEQLKRLYND